MNTSEQVSPLKKTTTTNYGLVCAEYRTNFDDLLNYDGNRCYYLDMNEALNHGYTSKQCREFNQRVKQLANAMETNGVAKSSAITACEYDGRYFITDGQGRRAAIDLLNSTLPAGKEKYGLHVLFFHLNNQDELLDEIFKANAFHHAWKTDDKMRTFAKIDKDGNVQAAYDVISKKYAELQEIIPNSLTMSVLYEVVFGDSGRWSSSWAKKCTFTSNSYWKYSLSFIDTVLKPFLEEIKKNYNSGVGISHKKHIITLTQQKVVRAYVKLFKELERWTESHNFKVEDFREYLIKGFLSWTRMLNKERIDHLNFKSAPVTYASFCRDLAEYVPGDNKKMEKELKKFLSEQIKNQ